MYDNSACNEFECELCDWCMQVEVVCVARERENAGAQQSVRGHWCVCVKIETCASFLFDVCSERSGRETNILHLLIFLYYPTFLGARPG